MARDDHEVLDVSHDPWIVRLQDTFQWLVTALHLDDDAGGARQAHRHLPALRAAQPGGRHRHGCPEMRAVPPGAAMDRRCR